MSGKHYLLDTNIIIDLFGGSTPVADKLKSTPGIFLSVTVLGELHYGAAHSARKQENKERIESFSELFVVLEVNAEIARQYGLTLVTRDQHFEKIKDLETESW